MKNKFKDVGKQGEDKKVCPNCKSKETTEVSKDAFICEACMCVFSEMMTIVFK